MQRQFQQLTLAIMCSSSTEIDFLTGSGQQISTTLGLLYEHLKRIIGRSDESQQHIICLKLFVDKLKYLLTDASRLAVAELSQNIMKPKPSHRRRPTQPILVQWELMGNRATGQRLQYGTLDTQIQKRSMAEEIEIVLNLPIGKAIFYLPDQSPLGHARALQLGARLLFIPQPQLLVAGLTISIIPGLAPMIACFNIQSKESDIFTHLYRRDLQRVRQAFLDGTASPNDRDEYGNSLMFVRIVNHVIIFMLNENSTHYTTMIKT